MAIYIIMVVAASFIQIGTIYLLRENIVKNLAYAIPLVVVYQLLFLWSYSNAPKFIVIWFIATSATSILAFLASLFLWKEHVSIYNIVGIAVIFVGIGLLRLK